MEEILARDINIVMGAHRFVMNLDREKLTVIKTQPASRNMLRYCVHKSPSLYTYNTPLLPVLKAVIMSGYVEDCVRQVEYCVLDAQRPRSLLGKHKKIIDMKYSLKHII